jgi:hypothetical protein
MHAVAPDRRPAAPVDPFGPIHRAIRRALGALLAQLASEPLTEPARAALVVAELEQVLTLCEDHRRLEDRFIFPELGARLKGSLGRFVEAHTGQPRQVAELQALGKTLLHTGPASRAVAGRTLNLHFSTFCAELLLHMADEEQLLLPLLTRALEAEELAALQQRLVESMSTGEQLLAARYLLPALDRPGRAALISQAAARLPAPARAELIDLARTVLPVADFEALTAALPR